jgi:hypothetical protein
VIRIRTSKVALGQDTKIPLTRRQEKKARDLES